MAAPESDNARGQAGVIEAQETADAAMVRAQVDAVDKRVATLKARAALAGYQLHVVADGFMVARWGLTHTLPTADEAERWLDRAGAPR